MGIERTSASPEELLAEVEWVRRVARALVGRGESDEVVQQAYLQALSSPPAPGPLRRWLRTVVRNVVRRRVRDDATRERHEVRAPVAARTPEPGETVARAELHGRVVEAVLSLDEPYRSTLLLRFFEDQPAEAIARAQSLPIETVRTRVKRGIAQLRTRLERAAGGDDEAGVAARALLVTQLHDLAGRNVSPGAIAGAATGAAALATGGVVMSIAMKGSIAAAVVAIAGLSAWLVHGGDARRLDVGTASTRAPQAATGAAELPPPQSAARAAEPVAAASDNEAKGEDTAATSAPASGCSVRGVVTNVAGRPAAGVTVMALIASRSARANMEAFASIAKNPTGTTDEISGASVSSRAAAMTTTDGDGRFTLAGLSDEDAWIVGAVDDEGSSAESDKFRFDETRRSVECDLKLVPSVELKGRVVDTDGSPIGSARVMVVFIWDGQRKASQDFITAFAGRDAGTWSTGRHPVEAFEVRAEAPGFEKRERVRVDVPPDRHEVNIEIVLEAKEGVLTKGPIVDESGRPFDLQDRMTKLFGDPLPDEHEPWKLQVSAVDEAAPAPPLGDLLDGERVSGRILFDEGSYEFRLPENFRGWLALTIEHRVVGTARLESPATPPPLPFIAPPPKVPPDSALVIVTVVDGTTGAAIDARSAGVFVDDAWILTSNPVRRAPRSVPVPEGAVAFFAPLERVKVRAMRQGFVSSCPELVLTKAGERNEVTVTLSPADCGIRGRALNQDGSPIADVEVDVYRATEHGLEGVPAEPAHTNPDGSFHVHGLAAGAYTVVVSHGKDAPAIAHATAASPPPTIELRSPEGQLTSFRVVAPRAPDGRTDRMVRIVDDSGIPVCDEFGAYGQTVHQSENFDATLAPGRYRVFVWFHGCREGSVEFDVPAAGTVEIPVERAR